VSRLPNTALQPPIRAPRRFETARVSSCGLRLNAKPLCRRISSLAIGSPLNDNTHMSQDLLAVRRLPHDDPLVRELDYETALLRQVTIIDEEDPAELVERLDYVGIQTIWEARHNLRKFRQAIGRLSILLSAKAQGGTVRRGISLRLLCLLLIASADNASENTMLDYLEWVQIGPSAEREQQAQRAWTACLQALKPAIGEVQSNAESTS